jgi:hypothetical protein
MTDDVLTAEDRLDDLEARLIEIEEEFVLYQASGMTPEVGRAIRKIRSASRSLEDELRRLQDISTGFRSRIRTR